MEVGHSGGAVLYQIEFTEPAAAQRHALPEDRRKLLERGLLKLAEDPFTTVSQAVSGKDIRAVSVAPGLTARYMVHRAFLILVSVALLDQSLIDE
jgi:hypothetical protein